MATALIERPRQELVTQWQIYFDEELRDVGVRAPAPIVGQSPKKYAAGTCEDLKAHIPAVHPLAQVDFYELQGQALSNFAEQMTRAVKEERNNPLTVEPGKFRKVERLDEYGKVKRIDWIGPEHFTKQMSRPGRRVVGFTTDRGRYDAVKARWF